MNELNDLRKVLEMEETMLAHVYTFPVPATAEQPRKILEEAGELVDAYARWDISRAVVPTKRVSVNVEDELADVVMACCNMAAAEGIDLEAAMERCMERQARRGRYDGAEADTCHMVDHGEFMPHHEFKRLACSECGGMHWEQNKKSLPKMRYCPWCGAEVSYEG